MVLTFSSKGVQITQKSLHKKRADITPKNCKTLVNFDWDRKNWTDWVIREVLHCSGTTGCQANCDIKIELLHYPAVTEIRLLPTKHEDHGTTFIPQNHPRGLPSKV